MYALGLVLHMGAPLLILTLAMVAGVKVRSIFARRAARNY